MNEIRRIADKAIADRIGAIVGDQGLPSIVDHVELEFGRDSVDEPAVWIVLHTTGLPRDPRQATNVVEEINNFSKVIRERILDNELSVFPYFRIVSKQQEILGG